MRWRISVSMWALSLGQIEEQLGADALAGQRAGPKARGSAR